MSIRLDGLAILKAVVGHSELFSDVRTAVDKAALAILAAQLKAETFDLERLKRTRKTLGADVLALALEHLPDNIPKSLIARIDPHHRKHATGSAAWARSHVIALAGGAAAPEHKRGEPVKNGASPARKKPRPEQDLNGEGFWATSVMAKPQRSRPERKAK
jgi:hypothetical protein